jgi:uncharacterized protein YutE (UPF0331/DUF86 family)
MTRDETALLKEDLEAMNRAMEMLRRSFERCSSLSVKPAYTPEEEDWIEALTARFARVSDFVVQRIFRLIDRLDLEDGGTVRDRILRAEKKGLIKSAERWVEIRRLRNAIAHEYLPKAPETVFPEVMEYVPDILDSGVRVHRYAAQHYDLNEGVV